MNGELPEGWAQTPLQDLIEPGGLFDGPFGSSLKSDDYTTSGVRVIRLENIANLQFVEEKHTYISKAKYETLRKHTVGAGDVIVGSFVDGAVRVCVLPKLASPAIAKADCFCVRSRNDHLDRRFLAYQLGTDATRDALVEHIHGATRPRITTRQLREFEIAVPPLPEQRRIVEKIEALLADVNAARERLAKVPLILKRFRQAVLAAACSAGDHVEIGSLIDTIRYGTSVKCSPEPVGTPVLRIPNVVSGVITRDDLKFGQLDQKERAALRLTPGDILMIRSNGSVGLVGRTALVTEDDTAFAYAGYLMRLQPKRELLLPEYANLALQTYGVRLQIELPARSTSGVHNINSEEVRRLTIQLPSLAEQRAIVRRVDAVFAVADAIEERVTLATARADKLPQAILSKAFRGELVPTEAEIARAEGRSYETAEEMLGRFRAPAPEPTRAKRRRKALTA